MSWILDLFLTQGETIALWLGIITATAAAVGVIWKWLISPLVTFMSRVWGCLYRIEGAITTLDIIAHEFQPNSGHSLRDVIDRLETYVAVSNTKVHSIMNYHRIAAWESDATGICIWASDELLKVMGRNWEQMQGFNWLSGILPKDRESVEKEWSASVAAEREFYMEYHVNLEDPQLVVGRAIQVRDVKGLVKGFVGTLQPIQKGEKTSPPGPGLPLGS